jgi:hypothetical protein
MTRSTVILAWFAAIVLAIAVALAFGAAPTSRTTWAMLLALSLGPPVILLLLWPGAQPLTVGEVLRGTDRDA